MPIHFLSDSDVEKAREIARRVLGQPLTQPTDREVYNAASVNNDDMAVNVIAGPFGSYWLGSLQERIEHDGGFSGEWVDFDPSVWVWAIGYNDTDVLTVGERYHGMLVLTEETYGLGVYACTKGGGDGTVPVQVCGPRRSDGYYNAFIGYDFDPATKTFGRKEQIIFLNLADATFPTDPPCPP